MADTQRNLAALLALCPDNAAREISAQDLRDVFVSLMGVHGEIVASGGDTDQTLAAQTWETIENWTADGESSGTTPQHSSHRIRLDLAGVYLLTGGIVLGASASWYGLEYRLAKNGAAAGPTTAGFVAVGSYAEGHSAPLAAIVTAAAGDLITAEVRTQAAPGRDVRLLEAHLGAMMIG